MADLKLSDLTLRSTAPSEIRKAVQKEDLNGFRKILLKQWKPLRSGFFSGLKDRRLACTIGISSLLQQKDQALFELAIAASNGGNSTAEEKLIASLIDDLSDNAAGGLDTEFQMLLAMELLVRYGSVFTSEQFAQVCLAVSKFDPESALTETSSSDLNAAFSEDHQDEESKQQAHQLMCRSLVRFVEIPAQRSRLFSWQEGSQADRRESAETLGQFLEASCETDGTVHARLASSPESWLSPLIRIGSIAAAADVAWAKPKVTKQYISALEFFAALSIHGGWLNGITVEADSPMESDDASVEPNAASIADGDLLPVDFFRAALLNLQSEDRLRMSKRSKGKKLKSLLKESSIPDVVESLASRQGKARKKPGPELDWYTPSTQSDWAESALLRTGYEADADSLLVTWDRPEVQLFLSPLGCGVAAGDWTSEVTVNEKAVAFEGAWTCTCWFQDDDVAFAELERGSSGPIRHVRHVMLHLKDHFAVLAETVHGSGEEDIVSLRTSLPLASALETENHSVTREIFLKTAGPSCRVLPAWLPDDRVHSGNGDCRLESGTLQSVVSTQGGAFLPLVIDWHPKNSKREADWNRLTVSEEGQVLTGYHASAVRTRIGRRQLMLYRSLKRGETLRAVLGHHTANETVYGVFTDDGEVEPLVMVEASE